MTMYDDWRLVPVGAWRAVQRVTRHPRTHWQSLHQKKSLYFLSFIKSKCLRCPPWTWQRPWCNVMIHLFFLLTLFCKSQRHLLCSGSPQSTAGRVRGFAIRPQTFRGRPSSTSTARCHYLFRYAFIVSHYWLLFFLRLCPGRGTAAVATQFARFSHHQRQRSGVIICLCTK